MKRSFPYIVVTVIFSLVMVFGWQLFWLNGLYKSMEEELKREITSCLVSADQLELTYRTDKIEQQNKKKNYERMISITGKSDTTGNIAFTKEEHFVKRNKEANDTTITTTELNSVKESLLMEQLFHSINTAMHDALDTEIPIDLHLTDSLFRSNLNQKLINTKHYYTELYDAEKDSVFNTTKTKVTSKIAPSPTLSHFYDSDHRFCYRVYMEPLTTTILIRMGGILATTLLIIAILGFAFWYLIRTVLNQKTLEEMKDDFTNNMTHELKTPIAVAYSAADALLNFNPENSEEKRRKYLQICKDQLTRLSSLVEHILSMSMEQRKSFALRPEEILIQPLVSEIVEQQRLKTDKKVSITLSCQPEDLTVYADRTHLANILSNLIDNAIKYTEADPVIAITICREDRQYRFTVSDNGTGIPVDKQAHIFDKFYRVPRGNLHNVKGYGLGLFYVRTMVEKHGGSISLKSSPGKGAEFTILIPAKNKTV